MPIHNEPHPLAGKTVLLPDGLPFVVEDYWDRLCGKSWMLSDGNLAAMKYAIRTGLADEKIPTNDEVIYGHHPNGLGDLYHVTEIREKE